MEKMILRKPMENLFYILQLTLKKMQIILKLVMLNTMEKQKQKNKKFVQDI